MLVSAPLHVQLATLAQDLALVKLLFLDEAAVWERLESARARCQRAR
jgi:hypothetical protein